MDGNLSREALPSARANPVTSLPQDCDQPLEDPATETESGDAPQRFRAPNRVAWLVGAIALCLSFSSFVYFYGHRMTNVYGDGVAHLNIAHKVVDSPDDSLWQRYMQIGSPWLP